MSHPPNASVSKLPHGLPNTLHSNTSRTGPAANSPTPLSMTPRQSISYEKLSKGLVESEEGKRKVKAEDEVSFRGTLQRHALPPTAAPFVHTRVWQVCGMCVGLHVHLGSADQPYDADDRRSSRHADVENFGDPPARAGVLYLQVLQHERVAEVVLYKQARTRVLSAHALHPDSEHEVERRGGGRHHVESVRDFPRFRVLGEVAVGQERGCVHDAEEEEGGGVEGGGFREGAGAQEADQGANGAQKEKVWPSDGN